METQKYELKGMEDLSKLPFSAELKGYVMSAFTNVSATTPKTVSLYTIIDVLEETPNYNMALDDSGRVLLTMNIMSDMDFMMYMFTGPKMSPDKGLFSPAMQESDDMAVVWDLILSDDGVYLKPRLDGRGTENFDFTWLEKMGLKQVEVDVCCGVIELGNPQLYVIGHEVQKIKKQRVENLAKEIGVELVPAGMKTVKNGLVAMEPDVVRQFLANAGYSYDGDDVDELTVVETVAKVIRAEQE